MGGVQRVPNSTETWLEAAKYGYKQKCGERASAASSEEGIVAKSAFSTFGDKQDQIWDALVKAEYIDKNGVIQKNFDVKRESFKLKASLSTDQENQTFDILQQAYYPKQLKDANRGRPHPAAADLRWWPWIDHNLQGEDIMFEGPDPVCPEPPEQKPCEEPEPFEPLELTPDKPPVHGRKKIRPPAKVPATKETKIKIELALKQANKLIDNLKKLRRKDLADDLQKTANIAKKATFEREARRALKNLNAQSQKAREKIQEIMGGYEK